MNRLLIVGAGGFGREMFAAAREAVGYGTTFEIKGFLDAKPTLPPGDTGRGYNGDLAAAIRFSPDGRRVVVSNRGENSLLAFGFDPATGALAAGARSLLPGSWPRDFIFVSDTLALVTMERSGEVLSLRYDPATGSFSVLSALSGLFRPVALTLAPA